MKYLALICCLLGLAGLTDLAPKVGRAADLANSEASPLNTTNYFASSTEALGMLLQVVANLEETVRSKDPNSIHSEDIVLAASLVALRQQSRRVAQDRRVTFQAELEKFAQQVAALHLAGDLQQQSVAEEKLRT